MGGWLADFVVDPPPSRTCPAFLRDPQLVGTGLTTFRGALADRDVSIVHATTTLRA